MARRIDRVHGADDADEYRTNPAVLRHWLGRVEGRFMGYPLDIHPHDAVLWAMRVCAGEAAYCDAQIARLSEDELFERPLRETYVEGDTTAITEVRDAETMSRWVTWRDHALHRMAQYAKMAADMKIDEEQVRIAKEQAQLMVNVITAILVDLGHDVRDVATRDIVRRRLMEGAIEGTATYVMEGEVAS